jgi:hypothetical protein
LAQGTIENPVINSPFVEPTQHFATTDGQVTGEIEPRRRPSAFERAPVLPEAGRG